MVTRGQGRSAQLSPRSGRCCRRPSSRGRRNVERELQLQNKKRNPLYIHLDAPALACVACASQLACTNTILRVSAFHKTCNRETKTLDPKSVSLTIINRSTVGSVAQLVSTRLHALCGTKISKSVSSPCRGQSAGSFYFLPAFPSPLHKRAPEMIVCAQDSSSSPRTSIKLPQAFQATSLREIFKCIALPRLILFACSVGRNSNYTSSCREHADKRQGTVRPRKCNLWSIAVDSSPSSADLSHVQTASLVPFLHRLKHLSMSPEAAFPRALASLALSAPAAPLSFLDVLVTASAGVAEHLLCANLHLMTDANLPWSRMAPELHESLLHHMDLHPQLQPSLYKTMRRLQPIDFLWSQM
jgi:hypothetical protein